MDQKLKKKHLRHSKRQWHWSKQRKKTQAKSSCKDNSTAREGHKHCNVSCSYLRQPAKREGKEDSEPLMRRNHHYTNNDNWQMTTRPTVTSSKARQASTITVQPSAMSIASQPKPSHRPLHIDAQSSRMRSSGSTPPSHLTQRSWRCANSHLQWTWNWSLPVEKSVVEMRQTTSFQT